MLHKSGSIQGINGKSQFQQGIKSRSTMDRLGNKAKPKEKRNARMGRYPHISAAQGGSHSCVAVVANRLVNSSVQANNLSKKQPGVIPHVKKLLDLGPQVSLWMRPGTSCSGGQPVKETTHPSLPLHSPSLDLNDECAQPVRPGKVQILGTCVQRSSMRRWALASRK
ncbi:hypothetical protein BDU57DRAFT_527480 [Ampelomyces quisqualis]|uniref:Uncharacterized protein n=1 Tax=Ampelomyces quisqualis TaxID=50730 RepID=A0A6A5QXA2_AMPQU|nr:hypothetical protein BDU57DRAFT_527480 [Ampelomyces quisqualis]